MTNKIEMLSVPKALLETLVYLHGGDQYLDIDMAKISAILASHSAEPLGVAHVHEWDMNSEGTATVCYCGARSSDEPVVERQTVEFNDVTVMLAAHELCPKDLLHEQRMAWMAQYFRQLATTSPPELAELQATIARLTADLKIRDRELEIAAEYHSDLQVENERLNKQLCVCPSCHGQGEIFAGSHSYQGQWQPPEPDMDKCGECDGDGVIGTPVDLAAALAEIKRLKGGQGEPVEAILLSDCVTVHNQDYGQCFLATLDCVKELYTSQPAPVSVPQRKSPTIHDTDESMGFDEGWNACLDKAKELNQ